MINKKQVKVSAKQQARIDAIKRLKKMRVIAGRTIYVQRNSVSRSGMTRYYRLKIVYKGDIWDITELVNDILQWGINEQGLRVSGCGMDMAFYTVYCLGYALYPKGFKLAKGQYGRNGDKSGFDRDGGYALHYSWL